MPRNRYRPSIELSDSEIQIIRSRLKDFVTDKDVVQLWIKHLIASELANLV